MPIEVLTDARVEINSVVLSDHSNDVKVAYGAEIKEKTAFGETTKSKLPGVKDWSVDITFMQDFDAAKVDATLFSLVGAAAFPVKIRRTTAVISATNPEFQGNALLASYSPISGKHGDVHTVSVKLEGTATLTRAVA
jgi:predicted secreted protein